MSSKDEKRDEKEEKEEKEEEKEEKEEFSEDECYSANLADNPKLCARLRQAMDDFLEQEFADFQKEFYARKEGGIDAETEVEMHDQWEVRKHLWIQFGALVPDYQGGKSGSVWWLRSLFWRASYDGIKAIEEVKFTKDKTRLEVESEKNDHKDFVLTDNMVDLSKEFSEDWYTTHVLIRDLYNNFEPRHFSGKCYTRGDFIGWNELKLK